MTIGEVGIVRCLYDYRGQVGIDRCLYDYERRLGFSGICMTMRGGWDFQVFV